MWQPNAKLGSPGQAKHANLGAICWGAVQILETVGPVKDFIYIKSRYMQASTLRNVLGVSCKGARRRWSMLLSGLHGCWDTHGTDYFRQEEQAKPS